MPSLYESFYQALQSIGYTHPVHPIFTYVPIGAVIAALLFGLIALVFRLDSFAVSARHSIKLALVFVFPTILFGYVDWQYFHGGNWGDLFVWKIILAAVLTVLLLTAALLHRSRKPNSPLILFIYVLCFLTVTGLGYFGGEIVFGTAKAPHEHTADARAAKPAGRVVFADVAEIFNQSCIGCHKGENPPLGLRLTTYPEVMEGSENGPVVKPGKPAESELVLRIQGETEPSMPFRQPLLPQEAIQTVVRWVAQGAPKEETGGGKSPISNHP